MLTAELVCSPRSWNAHCGVGMLTAELVCSPRSWYAHCGVGMLTAELVCSPWSWYAHCGVGMLTAELELKTFAGLWLLFNGELGIILLIADYIHLMI